MSASVGPSAEDARIAVQLGALAPSVHNSQPWRFRWDGTRLELREDRSRALKVLDPAGRELVLSCGAALLGARLAFAELGWATSTSLLPDGEDGDLLATLTPTGPREPSAEEHALALAAPRRATDRDPYDERPVPTQVLDALAHAAEAEGGWLRVVDAEHGEIELDTLLARADAAQRGDPAYLAELEAWRAEDGPDSWVGIPSTALPTVPASDRGDNLSLRDFDAGHAPPSPTTSPTGERRPEHPTVLVLGTHGDDRRDWLVAGQALMRVLLRATVADIAAQPVTSVLEVPVLRGRLRAALGVLGQPQMVLRAGYGTAGPTTHRLPVDEVLDIVEP